MLSQPTGRDDEGLSEPDARSAGQALVGLCKMLEGLLFLCLV